MAIITFTTSSPTVDYAMLNMYPDQYVPEKQKQENDWIKVNMDYFYNIALKQYTLNKQTFVRNYELFKGILRKDDFFQEAKLQNFTDTILKNDDLPGYVKHYSILTPPVNTLVGEMTKRPDNVFVKAFDEDSINEEISYRTEVLQQLVISTIQERIQMQLSMSGQEVDNEQLQQMTTESANQFLSSYTTQAEKWGAKILELMKVRFNIKDKSEDAFRDLLISGREFYHIYEDDSAFGFNCETLNPKNVWTLSKQEIRYTSDPLDPNNGVYAGGTIGIMELSEIIHKFKLPKDEIEHLKKMSQQSYLLDSKRSSLVDPTVTGPNSVSYNNYDRAVLEYRYLMEGELAEGVDELSNMLGITTNVGVFGNKYLVIQAYWCSKKKVGKLTFINEEGQEQIIPVDENYKPGSHPQQISLEWGWVNQWYQGVKIGIDVYHVKPLEILDYCPIIGCYYETKNVNKAVSLIDQMKPFQMLYNIAMNQLFRLLEKDMGVVFLTSIRHVPVPKDGDYQDALDVWEAEAREKGVIFIDDSPENLKAPSSFNQHTRLDLSRANEIQARYQLAIEMRNECWKLVGLSEQRLGESKATETATGINTSLTQSYAQTEPWFAQHEYVLNKFYQALLDAALVVQSTKPTSTISFISDEGERAFVQVSGSDLKLKEIGVFVTSRSTDAQNYQEFKMLAQAMLQNGASPYEISLLYGTKSMKKMQDIYKKLKEKQDAFQQEQQNIEKQKIESAQQQAQQAQQLLYLQQEKQREWEAYQKEQDRLSKEKIAIIQASGFGKISSEDADNNGFADIMELNKLQSEQSRIQNDYQAKIQDLTIKQQQLLNQSQQHQQKMQLEKEKLQVERENMKNDEKIAKLNSKNRSTSKKK